MPVDTNGGKANIKGGYNDIGRDGHFTRYRNSHNVSGSTVQGSFNTNSDVNLDIGRPTPVQFGVPQSTRRHPQVQDPMNSPDREIGTGRPGNNPAWRDRANGHPPGHNHTVLSREDEDRILENARRIEETRAVQALHRQDPYGGTSIPPSSPRENPGLTPTSGRYDQPYYPPPPQVNPDRPPPDPQPPFPRDPPPWPPYPQPVPSSSHGPCILHPVVPSPYSRNPFIPPPPQQGPAQFPQWDRSS